MSLKLATKFLAGTLLLIGLNGTAIGGECENVLERMRTTLELRNQGDDMVRHGSMPSALLQLPYDKNISVIEDKDSPKTIRNEDNGNCFKLSGKWSQNPNKYENISSGNSTPYYYPIIAYVFFNNPSIDKIEENLTVDSSIREEDEKGKRLIALTATHKGEEGKYIAGAALNDNPQNLRENIIWLPLDSKKGSNNSIEVVLCEGPCSAILYHHFNGEVTSTSGKVQQESTDDNNQENTKVGTVDTNYIYCEQDEKTTKKDRATINQLQEELKKNNETQSKEFKSKTKTIGKNAITKFMKSKTSYKFVDEKGRELKGLGHKNLITKKCSPPKIKHMLTQNDTNMFFYKNCVSIRTKSGYKLVRLKIEQSDNNLVVTYTLKKIKPAEISEIEISVKMADGSKITKECTLTAKIIGTNSHEEVFEGTFESARKNKKEHTFRLKFDKSINPIAWKGKTLVLEKYDGADCQPKDGKVDIDLTLKDITLAGELKLQDRLELHSTLGKALLVLNTMIGEDSVNGSDSSVEFYPTANDEFSRKLFTEMVTQSLQQLGGKVKGLNVWLRDSDGLLYFKDFSNDFKKLPAKDLAKIIIDEVSFAKGLFIWDTVVNAVQNQGDYTYRIFIGQSGLSNDKSYCENHPNIQQFLEQGPATYIYDFAVDANIDNPPLDKSKGAPVFPYISCKNDKTAQHIVFFPQTIKAAWRNPIHDIFSAAFKDR